MAACRRWCERWLETGLKNGWNEFNERQKSFLEKRASKEVSPMIYEWRTYEAMPGKLGGPQYPS